jgi:hypothetical protein
VERQQRKRERESEVITDIASESFLLAKEYIRIPNERVKVLIMQSNPVYLPTNCPSNLTSLKVCAHTGDLDENFRYQCLPFTSDIHTHRMSDFVS